MEDITSEPRHSRRSLTTSELRLDKPARDAFLDSPRAPITVLLDGVRRAYNLGAIVRLCDAFLVERLIFRASGAVLNRARKFFRAARGTERWVQIDPTLDALEEVVRAKQAGATVVAAEQTTQSITPKQLAPVFPIMLVLGSEESGVSPEIVAMAGSAVAIPVHGMANSLNVSTVAAILIHQLSNAWREQAGTELRV